MKPMRPTIERIPTFTLLQWKHALPLEQTLRAKGVRLFRRSLRAHAARVLGVQADALDSLIEAELQTRQEVKP